MYVCVYVKRGLRIKEQKHQNKLLYLDLKEKNSHRSDRNFLCILLINAIIRLTASGSLNYLFSTAGHI